METSNGGEGDGNELKSVEEIESLCMNCHKNGITKLLLTKIPFFREIVIMSFECPHCNFKNSEVQPAGEIQAQGHRYTFRVDDENDLSRQVIKSDTCVFRIEDIDLEIPPGRGRLTNVEGMLSMIRDDLAEKQPERRAAVPEVYEQIAGVIRTLSQMTGGVKMPFTITVDDPAGNSWVEPSTHDKSGKYIRRDYDRAPEQNASLGLAGGQIEDSVVPPAAEYHATNMYPQLPPETTQGNVDNDEIVENQVYTFPSSCPGCSRPCDTNMKMVNIPHFKQAVIMSTVCDFCGYRSNEVKTGGEIPEKGRRIRLSVENPKDLTRDILKSESCTMECPELDLHVEPGTLGGRFTTVEGLLTQVRDDLHTSVFDAEATGSGGGDSMAEETRETWEKFFSQLTAAIEGKVKFTVILTDPLAGSYVQSFAAPDPDEQMQVDEYERTEEEEEQLGLKDIETEDYHSGD